jgi:hypothetical protein
MQDNYLGGEGVCLILFGKKLSSSVAEFSKNNMQIYEHMQNNNNNKNNNNFTVQFSKTCSVHELKNKKKVTDMM